MFNDLNKENDNINSIDDELDIMGLFDNEKKIAKEDKYDSWDFEEEDMDEDNYYYEDE